MKVKTITVSRTKQVRPYEPERLEVQVEIEDGDDPSAVYQAARAFVCSQLGVTDPPPIEESDLY